MKQSSPLGVTQAGCSPPDTSVACRTVIIPLSNKQLYDVEFEIETTGGLKSIVTVSINVGCGPSVNISPGSPVYNSG
jgi:hypothetical protein